MKEQKQTTYGELKQRKAELRNEMKNGDFGNFDEYVPVLQAIKNAELMHLYSITTDESCGELPRAKKCRKAALVCLAIAGIAAVILIFGLFGCHTVNGVGRDLSAWSSPYIEHQEK